LSGSDRKSLREFRDQARGVVSDAAPDWQEVSIRAGFIERIEVRCLHSRKPDQAAKVGVIAESSRKSTLRVLRSGTGSLPKPLVFSFGGLGSGLAEQVARNVDQGEPSSFFWQFVGVGFDEYFDGFVAGVNFDTQRAALEIDFVTPSRFTANNCVGHLRSYERLKG